MVSECQQLSTDPESQKARISGPYRDHRRGSALAPIRRSRTVEVPVTTDKLAPARMHHFIAEQLLDLAVRGKVLSVLVEESTYLVTLSLTDRGVALRHLSAYDVGRSLR